LRGRNLYPQDVEAAVARAMPGLAPNGCAAFAIETGGAVQLAVVIEGDRGLVRATRGRTPEVGGAAPPITDLVHGILREVEYEFDVAPQVIALVRPGAFPRTTSG